MGRRILCLFLNATAVTHICTLLLLLLFPVGEVLCKKERRKEKGSAVWLGDYEAEGGGAHHLTASKFVFTCATANRLGVQLLVCPCNGGK